jgi:hypothetical protein
MERKRFQAVYFTTPSQIQTALQKKMERTNK